MNFQNCSVPVHFITRTSTTEPVLRTTYSTILRHVRNIWIEDLENKEGTIHLLAMTEKALGECKCKLDFLLEVRTLMQKEIDERNAHLGKLYQLLGRLDVVYATMVAA